MKTLEYKLISASYKRELEDAMNNAAREGFAVTHFSTCADDKAVTYSAIMSRSVKAEEVPNVSLFLGTEEPQPIV